MRNRFDEVAPLPEMVTDVFRRLIYSPPDKLEKSWTAYGTRAHGPS